MKKSKSGHFHSRTCNVSGFPDFERECFSSVLLVVLSFIRSERTRVMEGETFDVTPFRMNGMRGTQAKNILTTFLSWRFRRVVAELS